MSTEQSVETSRKKRVRQVNFSPSELSIIADEVNLRSNILFGAFSSTITNQSKTKEWDAIASKLNASSNVVRICRSQVKKKAMDFSKESRKTGGGCPPETLSDVEHKVVAMIPSCQIEGIPGGMDTEVINDDEGKTSSSLELEPVAEISTLTATLPVSTASSAIVFILPFSSSSSSSSTVHTTATTPTNDEALVTCATKPSSRSKKPQASSKPTQQTHVTSILEIEVVKRDTLKEILNIQREMLTLRREEVAINRERLALEKEKWEVQNNQNVLSLSPIIKF